MGDQEQRIRRLERDFAAMRRLTDEMADLLLNAGPVLQQAQRALDDAEPPAIPEPDDSIGICVACGVPATIKAYDNWLAHEFTLTGPSIFSVPGTPCNAGGNTTWRSGLVELAHPVTAVTYWWRVELCCRPALTNIPRRTAYTDSGGTSLAIGQGGTLAINSCDPLDAVGSMSNSTTIDYYDV